MKIALLSGRISTQVHGKFNIANLYEGRGLTGSESAFFNLAWGLAELGHDVSVFCDCEDPHSDGASNLAGAKVFKSDAINTLPYRYDAAISASEPDLFRNIDAAVRILHQQLNDFAYCKNGYDEFVDLYVFASESHRTIVTEQNKLSKEKCTWIPNSINLEFFDGLRKDAFKRNPHSAIWASSPDRGLHRILEMWPLVRKQVPDATLDIYYRFQPWYEHNKDLNNWAGNRARHINTCLESLGRKGENGVFLRDAVSNKTIIAKMLEAQVLPYTCDPIRFTEGFGVTVLDACAAGCIPIIPYVDALPEVFGGVAKVIKGKISDNQNEWVSAIVGIMTSNIPNQTQYLSDFACDFSRGNISRVWDIVIKQQLIKKWPHIYSLERFRDERLGQEYKNDEDEVIALPAAEDVFVLPEESRQSLIELGKALENPAQLLIDAEAIPKEKIISLVELEDILKNLKRPVNLKNFSLDPNPEIHFNKLSAIYTPGMVTFEIKGFKGLYHIWKDNHVNCHPSYWSHIDEHFTREAFWDIKPGDVVIDIGAAYGSYALTALAMGAVCVIAWTPEEYDYLSANLRLNNWHNKSCVFSDGLWSEDGWLAIWPHAPQAEFFKEKPLQIPEKAGAVATCVFPVSTLDSRLSTMELPRIDWVKFDVEGAEVEVLRGGRETVKKHLPTILVENHLFKDPLIKQKFGSLLKEINPNYTERSTLPHGAVSHTLWEVKK